MSTQQWTATVALAAFVRQRNVLLTTYRRDGTPRGTPVHLAVDGERAYFRTWDTTWKVKRIRRNPHVTIAPSTARGILTGPAIPARARILSGDEATHAAHCLARKYPILHGFVIPRVHRMRGYRTVQIALTPIERTRDADTGACIHTGSSVSGGHHHPIRHDSAAPCRTVQTPKTLPVPT